MIRRKGFTLIELVVVVVVIAVLAAIITPQVVRLIAKGRDSRRIADINEIENALRAYYSDYADHPPNTDNDHGGWDCTCDGVFIQPLVSGAYLTEIPKDPINSHSGFSPPQGYVYNYYRYSAGSYGMPSARGNYAVLGLRKFEVLPKQSFDTTQISGVTRNWGDEFDYYVILFQK